MGVRSSEFGVRRAEFGVGSDRPLQFVMSLSNHERNCRI